MQIPPNLVIKSLTDMVDCGKLKLVGGKLNINYGYAPYKFIKGLNFFYFSSVSPRI